jgi:hypothetical protein
MSNFWILLDVFVRAGYVFTALVLIIFYISFRKKAPVLLLASLSNLLVTYFSLIMGLLGVYYLFQGYHEHGKGLPIFLFFRVIPYFLIVVFFLIFKKRPLRLLFPFSLLLNLHAGGFFKSDSDELLRQLIMVKPYVLILMGLSYLLLLYLFYFFTIWTRKVMSEDPPPSSR